MKKYINYKLLQVILKNKQLRYFCALPLFIVNTLFPEIIKYRGITCKYNYMFANIARGNFLALIYFAFIYFKV